MKPVLANPVSPITINQPFGANAAYYEANFGQNGHPGIDFAASHGEPVYAAHDGHAIYLKDKHGGEGVWIYSMDGSFATIYWHLIGDTDANYQIPIPFDQIRHPVRTGDLIGYADNTGAPFESSGDHLHFGLCFIGPDGNVLNYDNGTDGCVDPQPYFDGAFATPLAIVKQQASTLVQAVAAINANSPTVAQQETLAEKIIDLIKQEIAAL